MKKITALFSGALLLASFSAAAFAADPAPAPAAAPAAAKPAAAKPAPPPKPLQEGDAVPVFSVQMLSGKTMTSADMVAKNKKIVVTFIQTACSACKGEIVELNRLAKGAGDKVLVLPVAVDMRSGKEFLENYKSENAVSFDFGIDPKFSIPKLFNISFTPASVLIEDGKVVKIFRGYDEEIAGALAAAFK